MWLVWLVNNSGRALALARQHAGDRRALYSVVGLCVGEYIVGDGSTGNFQLC